MTCIIGYVTPDAVWLGGDSAGVGGLSVTVRRDTKVFANGSFLMGFTSSFRMGQLLQYSFTPPDHDPRVDTDKYLRTTWIDAVRKTLREGGYAKNNSNQEEGGTFLVGYRGRLFAVYDDFQIAESALPYMAVGCGDDIAKGAMAVLDRLDLDPEAKIREALLAAERHSAGVRAPFVVLGQELYRDR